VITSDDGIHQERQGQFDNSVNVPWQQSRTALQDAITRFVPILHSGIDKISAGVLQMLRQ
jgi:hypothetical protein